MSCPDREVEEAARLLSRLRPDAPAFLQKAEYDDEPVTGDDLQALAELEADRGGDQPVDDAKVDLRRMD
ncbi:MAG: hypothetical protein GEU28_15015 [Dehalococcoidia bacterium]|nr:hypothetical protein [Dehalococcoidia bacterium]